MQPNHSSPNTRPLSRYLALAVTAAAALGFAACEVKKVEDGKMPEVKVEDGKLPKYDVQTPDVKVETKEKTIKVPDVKVDTKEKTISVPDIKVETPAEKRAEGKTE